MKKLFALILTLTLFISVPFVAAVNDSGLEWGIDEGDELHFIISYKDYNSTMESENVYMDVSKLPTIPDHIDNLTALMPAIGDLYFDNGTLVNETMTSIGGMAAALPIGNWSCLTSLAEDYVPPSGTVTVYDNNTHWGYGLTAPGVESVMYVYKIDGSLAYLYMQAGFVTMLLMEVEMVRTDPPTLPESTTEETTTTTESTSSGPPNGGFPIDPMILLLIGAAAVVVIIIVVVALNRRK
jgi:hypothetical protein